MSFICFLSCINLYISVKLLANSTLLASLTRKIVWYLFIRHRSCWRHAMSVSVWFLSDDLMCSIKNICQDVLQDVWRTAVRQVIMWKASTLTAAVLLTWNTNENLEYNFRDRFFHKKTIRPRNKYLIFLVIIISIFNAKPKQNHMLLSMYEYWNCFLHIYKMNRTKDSIWS